MEPLGFAAGEAGEFGLDLGDALLHGDGFQAGFVGGQVGLLGGAEDPGVEEPLVGRAGLVVDPFAASDGVGGVAGGCLRRSEEVQPVVDLGVMSRDVVESVEGYAANRRVVSVVVVEVEPAGQRQASFGL